MFLRLIQPIGDEDYPIPRVARSGMTYTFPFTFVVPDQLLDRICNHTVAHPQVKDSHIQLPPSLGDKEISTSRSSILDDLSPDMLRISYAITARMIRFNEVDGAVIVLARKKQKIRIIPVTDEQPPIGFMSAPTEYCLRCEKNVRKRLLNGKIGRIVMEAAQPPALQLNPPGLTDSACPTTMATVSLRFDPADGHHELPKFGALCSRLKVHTYSGVLPFEETPSSPRIYSDIYRAVNSDVVSLSSRNMQAAQWQEHAPHTDASQVIFRRDSTSSTTTTCCPEPTSAYSPHKPFYTTQLLIPVTLPDTKTFVPTFHSCLASRRYFLDLSLNISVSGGTPGIGRKLHLKIPLQISSKPNLFPFRTLSSGQISADESQLDGYYPDPSATFNDLAPAEQGWVTGDLPTPPPEYSFHTTPVSRRATSDGTGSVSLAHRYL